MRKSLKKIGLLFVIILLIPIGCASKEKVYLSTTSIQSAAMLNPNIDNQSSPVDLTLYQLTTKDKFLQADFNPLYTQATTALGKTLLDTQDLMVRPKQSVTLKYTLLPETQFIGAVAAYRSLDKSQWRTVIKVPNKKNIRLTVTLGTLAVHLARK